MVEEIHLKDYIEHTLLAPSSVEADFTKIITEAVDHAFRGVCIPSCHIEFVARRLSELKDSAAKGSSHSTIYEPLIVSVIGFPHGDQFSSAKAFEAQGAAQLGAHEIDMVLNIGWLKEKRYQKIIDEIKSVKAAANRPLKVILETHLLTNEEIETACRLTIDGNADFVKTATGYSGGGATVEHIRLMRKTVGPEFGVKASGGVRTREQALLLIDAGANRLGTSRGVELIQATTEEANSDTISSRNY